MSISVEVDAEQLTRSIESRDATDLLGRYADDAEVSIFDCDTSLPPRVLAGQDEIRGWLDQLGWSSMRHRVVDVVVDADRLSWTDHCRTSSGLNIVYQSVAELAGGLIRRQRITLVWEDLRY